MRKVIIKSSLVGKRELVIYFQNYFGKFIQYTPLFWKNIDDSYYYQKKYFIPTF
jgi:hypothetical protein